MMDNADPFAGIDFGETSDDGDGQPTVSEQEGGGLRTEVTQNRLTDEQFAQQLQDARYQERTVIDKDGNEVVIKGGFEAALAAGTNTATDADGNEVILTEKDYLPGRQADKGIVKNADAGFVKALQGEKEPATALSKQVPASTSSKDLGAGIDQFREKPRRSITTRSN